MLTIKKKISALFAVLAAAMAAALMICTAPKAERKYGKSDNRTDGIGMESRQHA